jgi:putative membrane protein
MSVENSKEKKFTPLIIAISIIIPAAVTILFYGPKLDLGSRLTFLPALNAFLNGTTSLLLILGVLAIKKGQRKTHEKYMKGALILSVIFLLSYIAYHASSEPAKYGGEGILKYLYFFILFTHIILAAAIVPLVLITFVRALSEKFDKHKKIAKITFPLWLYVTVTGVVVYFMISPYY